MLSALREGDEVAAAGLVPTVSGVSGFRQLLAGQTERLQQAGFMVSSQVAVEQLSAAQVQTLSAIVVEVTNNMLKHADPEVACRIRIGTQQSDVVAVFQNGTRRLGRLRLGMGLTGVRERLALLGGTCEVFQDPERQNAPGAPGCPVTLGQRVIGRSAPGGSADLGHWCWLRSTNALAFSTRPGCA